MGQELRRIHVDISNLKSVILQNNNIDVLLYLAKYNPKVTKKNIIKNFGKEALDGLKALKEFNLVQEEKGKLSLTDEGIFQVEGLLAIAV
ncbi:MAG: hypothetical protein ABIJ74_02215 [archaeon]